MQFKHKGKNITLKGVSESDWIYSNIKKTRNFYEIDLLRYMRFVMRQRPLGCILDIGANIGNHSVFFGSFIAEKVVAFEPNPKLFRILSDNLVNNSVKHKIYRYGLGADAKEAIIHIPKRHVNNVGAARLEEVPEGMQGNSETVSVIALDSLFQEIESFAGDLEITALKIDVEGMEADVLRGGQKLLAKYKPELFVEISNPEQMETVKSVISPLGYKPIVDWAATPVWHFANEKHLGSAQKMKLKCYILFRKKLARIFSTIIRPSISKIVKTILRLISP